MRSELRLGGDVSGCRPKSERPGRKGVRAAGGNILRWAAPSFRCALARTINPAWHSLAIGCAPCRKSCIPWMAWKSCQKVEPAPTSANGGRGVVYSFTIKASESSVRFSSIQQGWNAIPPQVPGLEEHSPFPPPRQAVSRSPSFPSPPKPPNSHEDLHPRGPPFLRPSLRPLSTPDTASGLSN